LVSPSDRQADSPAQAHEILRFWFEETSPGSWFGKDPAFDAMVLERFGDLTRQALAGALEAWAADPAQALALVLVLDQFTRQIWRGTARAFAGDQRALGVSLQALQRGWVEAESQRIRRQFWLMPQMHAEDLTIQEAAIPLFERLTDHRTAEFARRHRDVIARFGRFPHRNCALDRHSTAEELAFLRQPGSRF
jgi:uncharacterized protein (DUF924 family)